MFPFFRGAAILPAAYGSFLALCGLIAMFGPCDLDKYRCRDVRGNGGLVLVYSMVAFGVSGGLMAIGSLRGEEL